MPVFLKGLGVILLGVVIGLITILSTNNEYSITQSADTAVVATSTEPGKASTEAEPEEAPEEEPVATVEPEPIKTQEPEKPVTNTKSPLVPETPEEPEPAQPVSLSLNETVRAAVVNILCNAQGGGVHSITASGVVIDPRGVILTNSHVAQHFLLENYPEPDSVRCIIRTGNPAQARYNAELLFMPASWIYENAQKINDESPVGNGDHDYALLYITSALNSNTTVPDAFPYVALSSEAPKLGESVLIAAYPAGFLGGAIIQKELYQSSSIASVSDLYTFQEETLDLFSLGGSVLAQQGSSGGAAANKYGMLLGLLALSTDAPETASRDLRALSMPYLMRDFEIESGQTLVSFLAGDLISAVNKFATESAPALRQGLISAIENG